MSKSIYLVGCEDLPTPLNPQITHGESFIHLTQEIQKKFTDHTILKAIAWKQQHADIDKLSGKMFIPIDLNFQKGKMQGRGFSNLFAYRTSLETNTTSFDGELEAIRLVTRHLILKIEDIEKMVILSDSIAAIQAITSHTYADSVRLKGCIKDIGFLKSKNKDIVLQQIPSHCGILGNEMADLLAKRGTEIVKTQENGLSFSSIRRIHHRPISIEHFSACAEPLSVMTSRSEPGRADKTRACAEPLSVMTSPFRVVVKRESKFNRDKSCAWAEAYQNWRR